MITARRLEAEHREQATMRMYEDWLARADPQGVLSEQERIEVWRDCSRRQMSRINKYRKRPQMDDLREGMTDAERVAFDMGVQKGLLLSADVCGGTRRASDEACALGRVYSQIFSIAEELLKRYGREALFGPRMRRAIEEET